MQRTPAEILFNYTDPLLLVLGQSAAGATYLSSYETKDEAYHADSSVSRVSPRHRSARVSSTLLICVAEKVKTGTGNLQDALVYTMWRNHHVLPSRQSAGKNGFWCNADLLVTGHDDTQFPPGKQHFWSWDASIDEETVTDVWVSELYRGWFGSLAKLSLYWPDLLRTYPAFSCLFSPFWPLLVASFSAV